MLDMKTLLSEFATHVASMTDEEVRISIQNAERLTAGCASEVGDIGEYDFTATNETESQSIPASNPQCKTYSCISMYSIASCNAVTTWEYGENDAA